MSLIDPIEAFNAYNLSLTSLPLTNLELAFRTGFSVDNLAEQTDEQHEKITQVNPEFVTYIRDGMRCYVSVTMRREPWIMDGILIKEPKERIRMLKNNFY